jgi:hypothetical protein
MKTRIKPNGLQRLEKQWHSRESKIARSNRWSSWLNKNTKVVKALQCGVERYRLNAVFGKPQRGVTNVLRIENNGIFSLLFEFP